MQFFYLLCSQFRQKASSSINKTLLLVKQQKWLSEFCVKMHRVASKNWGGSGDRKHTYIFFWPKKCHRSSSVSLAPILNWKPAINPTFWAIPQYPNKTIH